MHPIPSLPEDAETSAVPSLVDSHCHLDRLDLTAFDGSLEAALKAARAQGVRHILCINIDLEHFADVVGIAEAHPEVSASVGVHPGETAGKEPDVQELVELARSPQVVAIGETGLDYHYHEGDLEWQRQRFRRHIQAARECRKPLVVHTREARKDTLDILREEGAEEAGGVMHCFTEDWDTARRALDLGFYISISGIVTFKKAAQVKEVAARVPLDRLLIETDAPYLAPVPYRGKPNQPAYVRYVAEHLAPAPTFIACFPAAKHRSAIAVSNYFSRSHGPPWECSPRRSCAASSGVKRVEAAGPATRHTHLLAIQSSGRPNRDAIPVSQSAWRRRKAGISRYSSRGSAGGGMLTTSIPSAPTATRAGAASGSP
jgi:TatD DNase family protein